MMAKLVADAIGGTHSCNNRKSGSVARGSGVSHISGRRLRAAICPSVTQYTTQLQCAVILGTCRWSSPEKPVFFSDSTIFVITIQWNFLPYNYIKHSQAA